MKGIFAWHGKPNGEYTRSVRYLAVRDSNVQQVSYLNIMRNIVMKINRAFEKQPLDPHTYFTHVIQSKLLYKKNMIFFGRQLAVDSENVPIAR